MAEIYKFFNSGVDDPRKYLASDFADVFGTVLSTGLIHTDHNPGMAVSVQTGTLNTVISTGKAIMDGYPYENTTPRTLTHNIPEPTLDRIDRIVLRLDLRNSERNILLHVKEGVPTTVPVAPDLQRDNFVYEISLAQIRVRKNTVQLLPSDLIDERLNEELCGLTYSMLSIPTEQFQRQWDEFMAGIVNSGFASAADFATHKADYVKHPGFGVATFTNPTYFVTLDPAPTEYKDGMGVVFKAPSVIAGNNFAINVNGLGAKNALNDKSLSFKNFKAGGIYSFRYSATASSGAGAFILQGEGGEYGTAVAADVLIGKTFGTENGIVAGALVAGKKFAKLTGGISGFMISPIDIPITGLNFTPKQAYLFLQGGVSGNGTENFGGGLATGVDLDFILQSRHTSEIIYHTLSALSSSKVTLSLSKNQYYMLNWILILTD